MKYLVMEIHPAYAVLLDDEGHYLKAANLRYQVGETVRDIVALREPAPNPLRLVKPLAGIAAMAASFCLIFFGYYQPNFTAYGTLRIQINPDVEMTISRTERVLELEGLNEDGMDLIEGYAYQGKSRDTATDELVDRAIDMGYLSGGDTISITVNSPDTTWQTQEEEQVRQQLEDRYGEKVVIRLGDAEDNEQSPEIEQEVVIPVAPQLPPADKPLPDPVSQAPAETNKPSDGTEQSSSSNSVTDYEDEDDEDDFEDDDNDDNEDEDEEDDETEDD